ncbi:glycosyl transferase family protein [Tropicimonas isoalkanivorans]|uniref:Anthranilate phosphoribosyltransferase n=1 Tax=Tropicimonas isoalkanivorans TaxID=441112 RepID=A0A1I1DJK0_9RHOB|nr:glycosyl transferase family protein [Tropicimonas isoalkanivorans]SFB74542.1 Anthranilate phosphoribosyltransferase [Tropicimonas isoalkanivorans]
MSLAPYIHAMGRGPSRGRSLTREEAQDAMRAILAGETAPEAVGALLMLMRYRGETPAEVAGFADAVRATLPPWPRPRPALDWPSYAAGRSRGLPWFLLSARLVAMAGTPVLIHGWNSHQLPGASVRDALPHAGISVARDGDEAAMVLDRDAIAYLPLEAIAPRALDLLRLRDVLGLRSAVNTVLRVMNPAGAAASVQGVFHPPYRDLQADAAGMLGERDVTIIKGGGGEFERHPSKDIALFGLRGGAAWGGNAPPLVDEARRLAGSLSEPADLDRLWRGDVSAPFEEAIVTGTAALALDTAGHADAASLALHLWITRHDVRAA